MAADIDLIFIRKSFDVWDTSNKNKIGVVLMFENTLHNKVDELGNKIPDYIIVMIVKDEIVKITSNILDQEDIKQYLENKYDIKDLNKL